MNVDNDLNIDEDNLEMEWLRQASLYAKYSELVAESEYKMNHTKEKLEILESNLDIDIRKSNSKITENNIKSQIKIDEGRVGLNNLYLKRRKEFFIVSKILTALEHKKKALENLVSMNLNIYYSQPRNSSKKESEIENNLREKMNEKLNRSITGE
jgi:BMFP domain-containing protein YqiC